MSDIYCVVKFEINVKKWGKGSCFCCSFHLEFSKVVLLIDRTSSLYLNERLHFVNKRLNAFDSVILFVFDTFLYKLFKIFCSGSVVLMLCGYTIEVKLTSLRSEFRVVMSVLWCPCSEFRVVMSVFVLISSGL